MGKQGGIYHDAWFSGDALRCVSISDRKIVLFDMYAPTRHLIDQVVGGSIVLACEIKKIDSDSSKSASAQQGWALADS
jgi:hypothetical protein